MIIEKFNKNRHMQALCSMLIKHGAYVPTKAETPRIGFGIRNIDSSNYIAFCFLRRVEGGYGQVDGLTSNPDCSQDDRHRALDLAIDACIKAAIKANITHLISFAENISTISRAERHGFKKQSLSIVTLDIKAKV